MLKAFYGMIWRDLLFYFRRRGEWAMPMIFFIMVTSLFPMALGPYLLSLKMLAPAIIWVAVLLSLLMSLENLFRLDYQEGILEQLLLSPYPTSLLLLGKIITHWLVLGLPLVIFALFVNGLLQGTTEGWQALLLTFLLGIPTLSLIGSMGAALTIGLPQGGILLTILVLPLMVPIVIFGASGVAKANQGLPFVAELLWLGALLLLAFALLPIVIAALIKLSVTP